MPFHDLNVPYTSNHAELSNTLAFHAELGYSVVALSLSITGKLPGTPQTIPISSLIIPPRVRTLTRLTLTISDTSQNHRLASLQPHYDILALRPSTEKAFQLCCNSLECDLISLDFSTRLPFILKFKTVASALQRGVRFEICYSPGIQAGNDARRNVISGAAALIRATRGRGIILSSEAKNALGLRGPYDVMNLAQVWGLGQERGKEGVCEEAAKVVRLAGMKRTSYRGVVDVIDGGNGEVPSNQQSTKRTMTLPQSVNNTSKPDATQDLDSVSSAIKRKASSTSLNTTIPTSLHPSAPTQSSSTAQQKQEPPLSKREQKRRAKKAKLEGRSVGNNVVTEASKPVKGFEIQHESLVKTSSTNADSKTDVDSNTASKGKAVPNNGNSKK